MIFLISACLLGTPCRYDGGNTEIKEEIQALFKEHTLIPICPEVLGGLPTPRPPAERQGDAVINRLGQDVTEEFRRGAHEAVRLARLYHADGVILKERSPSCGASAVYDGSFTSTLIPGEGITARALRLAGFAVYSSEGPLPDIKNEKSGERTCIRRQI